MVSTRNPSAYGKVIVITGASSGFGRGAAVALASGGAAVVLAARRAGALQEVARECEEAGGRALAVPTDVRDAEAVQRLLTAAVGAFGGVDVWVNDAGVGAIGRFEDIPLDDHRRVIEINLLGTIYGSYFALHQFRAQARGTLINIASALGKMPCPYYASYAASKFGVVGLSGSIRQELRENNHENIHVCTVMPMAMDTPFFEHAANYTGYQSEPVPPLYDAQKVVDTIVRLVDRPEPEVIVGAAGKVSNIAHNIAPRMTEAMLAHNTHKAQYEKAPPGPPTSGSLRQPMPEGTGLHGRRRAGDR